MGWQRQQPRRRRGRGCLFSLLGAFAVLVVLVIVLAVGANRASNNLENNDSLGGPAPSARYSVGQTATSSGFAFTVYAVKAPFTAPGGFPPTAGDEYVEVDVRVKNLDSFKQEDFSSLVGFHLLDSQNHQYDETFLPDVNPSAPDGQIAAGQAIRGYVTFEVPTGTTGLELRCQGSLTAAGAVFSLTA